MLVVSITIRYVLAVPFAVAKDVSSLMSFEFVDVKIRSGAADAIPVNAVSQLPGVFAHWLSPPPL